MDIKIGYCSWVVEQGLVEQIDYAAKNGFSSFSLLQSVMEVDMGVKREAAQLLKKSGLTLTWHANVLPPNIINDTPEMDYVNSMYAEVLWWHENAGGVFSCMADSSTRNVTRALVGIQRDALSKYGIRYGIENTCGDKYFATKEQMSEIYSLGADDPLMGILLDVGHSHVWTHKNGLDMEKYIAEIPGPIWEVHLNDNHGERDEHLPVCTGNIDYAKLCAALRKKKFSGVFTLEGKRSDGKCLDLREEADRETLHIYREKMLGFWNASK